MSNSIRHITRDVLSRSVFLNSAPSAQPSGEYDPVSSTRELRTHINANGPISSLVSWHENFHAFLNASTTFGSAMIIAGAVAESGKQELLPFVYHMIDCSIETHETYATASSVSALSKGSAIDGLLDQYPEYIGYFDSFYSKFPVNRFPKLSAMILQSCARVAMQTDVFESLLVKPVDEWLQIHFEPHQIPDYRFGLLFEETVVDQVVAATMEKLSSLPGDLSRFANANDMSHELESIALANASNEELENISEIAFYEFAKKLSRILGIRMPHYDQQKKSAPLLLDKLKNESIRLKSVMHTPDSLDEDIDAFLMDFRHERLTLLTSKLSALFVRLDDFEADPSQDFVYPNESDPYVQLIAMPIEKVQAMYNVVKGSEILTSWRFSVITGLRRLWLNENNEPRVEFLVLTQSEARNTIDLKLGCKGIAIASLYATREPDWQQEWLGKEGSIKRLFVLIDSDAFDLLDRFQRRGATVNFAVGRSPDNIRNVEILCLSASDEPGILYFTPCSTPFRQAVVEYAKRKHRNVHFEAEFLKPWKLDLILAYRHVIHEEGFFGNQFWL